MDLWKDQGEQELSPNVSNNPNKLPKASAGEKALYIFFWILSAFLLCIPMIVYYFKTKNYIINEKNEINEASSSIQVSQYKRFGTLTQLVEQVKSHYKFEQSVLDQITKNRNIAAQTSDINERQQAIDGLQQLINVQFERYPELKSGNHVMELMSQSTYLESEIAAARRTYNNRASNYNAAIFNFPMVCVAEKVKAITMPIFAASAERRKDVDMSSLSSW